MITVYSTYGRSWIISRDISISNILATTNGMRLIDYLDSNEKHSTGVLIDLDYAITMVERVTEAFNRIDTDDFVAAAVLTGQAYNLYRADF